MPTQNLTTVFPLSLSSLPTHHHQRQAANKAQMRVLLVLALVAACASAGHLRRSHVDVDMTDMADPALEAQEKKVTDLEAKVSSLAEKDETTAGASAACSDGQCCKTDCAGAVGCVPCDGKKTCKDGVTLMPVCAAPAPTSAEPDIASAKAAAAAAAKAAVAAAAPVPDIKVAPVKAAPAPVAVAPVAPVAPVVVAPVAPVAPAHPVVTAPVTVLAPAAPAAPAARKESHTCDDCRKAQQAGDNKACTNVCGGTA